MKNLLSALLAVTIYLTNGDVINIERNWLVEVKIWTVHTSAYVQYTIENEVHRIPMCNVLELVETPYQGGQQ